METIVQLISENGISIVLASAFIYIALSNTKTIQLLSMSNESIAKSLEILENTLCKHDERAISIKEDLTEIKLVMLRKGEKSNGNDLL